MREAARLQSFDDDFRLITSMNSEDGARIGVGMDMIGEAVPPHLSRAIALHIAAQLDARSPVSLDPSDKQAVRRSA
jgi:site-specific DNA-cytosine methylase